MSNQYFQFKQFRIDQDRCAMKVTTDACLQGAWTPLFPAVKRILDIGTGTGLLALMLAQKNQEVSIDAIELDKEAVLQAAENIAASPWSVLITTIEDDARKFLPHKKYDLIICNPPFFNRSLLGTQPEKNMARHTQSLSHGNLVSVLLRNTDEQGYISILLPFDEYMLLLPMMQENGLKEFRRLSVMHSASSAVKRIVGLFSKQQMPYSAERLIIKDNDGSYTPEFQRLLSPYYLDL